MEQTEEGKDPATKKQILANSNGAQSVRNCSDSDPEAIFFWAGFNFRKRFLNEEDLELHIITQLYIHSCTQLVSSLRKLKIALLPSCRSCHSPLGCTVFLKS